MGLGLSMYALNRNEWEEISKTRDNFLEFRNRKIRSEDGRFCDPDYIWDILGFIPSDPNLFEEYDDMLDYDDTGDCQEGTFCQSQYQVQKISTDLQAISTEKFLSLCKSPDFDREDCDASIKRSYDSLNNDFSSLCTLFIEVANFYKLAAKREEMVLLYLA